MQLIIDTTTIVGFDKLLEGEARICKARQKTLFHL